MHDIDPSRNESADDPEAFEGRSPQGLVRNRVPSEYEPRPGGPLTEQQESELASQLMEISSEDELDYFLPALIGLGAQLLPGLIKGISGLFGGKNHELSPSRGSALEGELKDIAKVALPLLGSAVGSIVPGIGTAIGGALGSALGGLFESELEGLAPEDKAFEQARRFVRLATTASQKAATIPAHVDPASAAQAAVRAAVQSLAPKAGRPRVAAAASEVEGSRGPSGRWIRRGNKIVLYGV
jgi:uncharacterized protein (DUF697 family)